MSDTNWHVQSQKKISDLGRRVFVLSVSQKQRALISCAVCVFVFRNFVYANCWSSGAAAHFTFHSNDEVTRKWRFCPNMTEILLTGLIKTTQQTFHHTHQPLIKSTHYYKGPVMCSCKLQSNYTESKLINIQQN